MNGGMSAARMMALMRRHPLITSVLIVVVARATFAVSGGVSLDDLKYFERAPPKELLLAQGRFGWLIVERLLGTFGISGPYWFFHATILGNAALVWAGFILSALAMDARTHSRALSVCLASILFALHPYHAEILTFREAFPFYCLAVLLMAFSLRILITGAGIGSFLLAGALMVFAVGINQLVLNLALVTVIFRLVARLSNDSRVFEESLWRSVFGVAGAAVASLVLMRALAGLFQATVDSRARLLAFEHWGTRFREVLETMGHMLRFDFPVDATLMSALLVGLCTLAVFRLQLATHNNTRRFAGIGLLLMALFASIGVVSVGSVYWPAPRTLVGFSLVTALLVVHALSWKPERLEFARFCVVALLLAGFTSIGNVIAQDQVRVNRWDLVTAGLINDRVSALGLNKLAFIGDWKFGTHISTRVGDMSLSAFAIDWARRPAMVEYTGRDWMVVDGSERTDWQRACETRPSWPHQQALFQDKDVAVLCF